MISTSTKLSLLKLGLALGLVCVALLPSPARAQAQRTYLRADGNSSGTYNLINSVLGGTAYEVPDCDHPVPHITQVMDPELGQPVFDFEVHVEGEVVDNDRCQTFDRQRVEIKTYNPSPDFLKCFEGESVSYSWDMRLDGGFQPSTFFTHLFQIKAVDGDDAQPFITITARLFSNGARVLQVLHSGQDSVATAVFQEELDKYLGRWLHITVEYTCQRNALFHIRMKETLSGEPVMHYNNATMDIWRDGNSLQRPKWGIYRSLNNQANLRDEHVYFNNFCIAKGTPLCA